ncbi:hypothetical protein [Acidithiobacillus concretivorus]|uniref:Uncharacterized protein n=1 Tax=Acidithiobacillus concretivorus TaxID=3063952 RepID=A0ABS5ZSG7_9PROT|nr:hypothetical protein [Acidithiobacillus concretivorus]MBU2739591.1 hypothetical protein [Acidithiobacillus concretivorus]
MKIPSTDAAFAFVMAVCILGSLGLGISLFVGECKESKCGLRIPIIFLCVIFAAINSFLLYTDIVHPHELDTPAKYLPKTRLGGYES